MPTVPISVPDGNRLNMRTSTEGQKHGLQWTLWEELEDVDFVEDLALPSHNQK